MKLTMLTKIRERFHPLMRLRSLRWFRRFQRAVDRPVTIRCGIVRQRVYWLRDISYIVLRAKMEMKTANYFDAVVGHFKPELFLDVGANIGSYSWRVCNLLPSAEVWLFEPDLVNGRLIAESLRLSDLPRATLMPVAVSDQAGHAEFLVDDVSGTTGSLFSGTDNPESLHSAYKMSHRRLVECIRLDSLLPKMGGRRTVIKMDVEGAEGAALAGAEQVLKTVRPIIFIECFDFERIAWIKNLNYLVRDLGESGNYLLVPGELPVAEVDAWFVVPGSSPGQPVA